MHFDIVPFGIECFGCLFLRVAVSVFVLYIDYATWGTLLVFVVGMRLRWIMVWLRSVLPFCLCWLLKVSCGFVV